MMGTFARIVVFVYLCSSATLTFATDRPSTTDQSPATDRRPIDVRHRGVIRGGPAGHAKAPVDTLVLIGPASLNPVVIGTFETPDGMPDWHGWTSKDWTVPDTADTSWHVSDYYAVSGTYSAYCGDETIPSCGAGDPVGGYDNGWEKILRWGLTVADPGLETHIDLSFAFDVDSEYGYDYAVLARELENEEYENLWQVSGDSTGIVTIPVTYAPGEYVGESSDEVGIWFIGLSDGGWSDADCDYPSTGIWRLDEVTITADNPATVVAHDFEDGTLGPFARKFRGAVGDFTHLASNLGDPDICVTNSSPQVTFIDDGVVQPATGGSYATSDNRRYADNFVVNYTGGLTFSEERRLHNDAVSPVIPWGDAAHDGVRLGFTVMTDSFFAVGEAGMFYEWLIRSTTGDAVSIEDATWQHSPFVYTGGPYYARRFWDVSDNLYQGRTYVQVMVGVYEYPQPGGHNGSPSPYFDNIRLESFPCEGPSVSTPTYCLAQDTFPEIGVIDTVDLGRNHIRFDQARNISDEDDEHYHNGDSITIDVVAVRTGAALTGRPRFHYKMKRNELFDPYRTAGLADSGVVVMDSVFTATGTIVADRYCADLPDTGFLFPGDVLHYYFSAEDAIDGWTDPMTSTLPADLSDWGDFTDWASFSPLGIWSHDFTVRGLPTVTEGYPAGTYEIPETLYWDDSESEAAGTADAWDRAASFWLGHHQGEDFDYYYTHAAGATVGGGLGGRATAAQLAGYTNMVYFSGDLNSMTLSNGDWNSGGGNDIALLEGWLDSGDKCLFLSGNSLAFDLSNSGWATNRFLQDRMMVNFVSSAHRDLLGGQLAPRVLETPQNPVLYYIDSWYMGSGCPELRDFDLVTPNAGERLAEFANASGVPGGYPYSPLTLAVHANGSRVISSTMDPVYTVPDPDEWDFPGYYYTAHSRILRSVIVYFGQWAPGPDVAVPDAGVFAATNHPNPFNPATEIVYSIRKPGHLVIKVYNLRGALVKTLIDGKVEQAGKVTWDGTDGQGGQVASGVYFFEARMGGDVQVGKMALVK